MDTRRILCPGCGAQLVIKNGYKKIKCDYCGGIVNVNTLDSDEGIMQRAIEAEERRIDELAAKIISLKGPILSRKAKCEKLSELNNEIQYKTNNKEELTSVKGEISSATMVIGLICVGFWFYGTYNTGAWFIIFPILAFVGLELIAMHFIMPKKNHKEEAYNIMMNELSRQRVELEAEIAEIDNRYNINFIPMQYHNEKDINGIYNSVKVKRATNLGLAISLYENECKAKKMLDNQNRMLAQQQEMIKQQYEQLKVNRQALEEAKRANRRDKVQDIASIGTTIYVGTKIWDHIKKNM